MKDKLFSLLPPCSYQGGKQRLCEKILNIIEEENNSGFVFYDLCCGSGSVGLEAFNRGYEVILVDKGPFGLFWEKIGNNTFDLDIFRSEIDKLPSVEGIQRYLKDLSDRPVDENLFVYHYLLLQAGSFGSKQIWIEGNKWCNNSFRSYWLPTESSNRKSPVNPMMPMPETLYSRVENIVFNQNDKIQGYYKDVFDVIDIIKQDTRNKVIYIDPPYMNTTGYFDNFDIYELIDKLIDKLGKDTPIYVSEGCTLNNAREIILSEGRKKGNVSGTVKKSPVIETLNVFNR